MMQSLVILFLSFQLSAAPNIDSILGRIPVQENGRLKPFDTFARETLQLVYGRSEYKKEVESKTVKMPATEIVMTWILLPEHWDQTEFIELTNFELKQTLKLDESKKYFSPNELLSNDRVQLLFQELDGKQKAKERLNNFFQAVNRLQNQLSLYKSIIHGLVPHWIPNRDGGRWLSLAEMPESFKQLFVLITEGFLSAIRDKNTQNLKSAVDQFVSTARGEAPEKYLKRNKLDTELFYNRFHPFQKAWIFYMLGALFCLVSLIATKPFLNKVGVGFAGLGFLFHTAGFGLRIFISERPPVSNMYETVVWVPWASMLFAAIIHKQLKNKFLIFAGCTICFLCMVVADNAPVILDASVQPLQAVLRSNMWLIIHVLTITISYGAFFLAFLLADIGLVLYLIDEKKKNADILALRDSIYRAIQVGVVLLAAGTILGGIWADYSWGRFWGWDPKETWALIALLGYLAILHSRLAGWLETYGFIVGAIVAFNLVLMAWYGVNFVLGAGKHSYGFGGGGNLQVSLFILAHFIFIGFVSTVRHFRKIERSRR